MKSERELQNIFSQGIMNFIHEKKIIMNNAWTLACNDKSLAGLWMCWVSAAHLGRLHIPSSDLKKLVFHWVTTAYAFRVNIQLKYLQTLNCYFKTSYISRRKHLFCFPVLFHCLWVLSNKGKMGGRAKGREMEWDGRLPEMEERHKIGLCKSALVPIMSLTPSPR